MQLLTMHQHLRSFALAISAAVLSIIPSYAQAEIESYTTTIVDVLKPEKPGDTWIYLLSAEGRALRVQDSDRPNIEILNEAVGKPQFIEISMENMGDFDLVKSIAPVSDTQVNARGTSLPIEPLTRNSSAIVYAHDFSFDGHKLTPEGIYTFFRSMRLRRGSQCFHRAYYWSHQLWRNTGVLSHKVFLFFTWKYIRRYNYYWWFHVAPYVYDDNGDEVVLDPTFLGKAVSMKRWTDNFLRNDPECPTVTNYKGHGEHARDQWCYLVKSPMHYYHPNVIEEANKTETKIKFWDPDYLAIARRSRP